MDADPFIQQYSNDLDRVIMRTSHLQKQKLKINKLLPNISREPQNDSFGQKKERNRSQRARLRKRIYDMKPAYNTGFKKPATEKKRRAPLPRRFNRKSSYGEGREVRNNI